MSTQETIRLYDNDAYATEFEVWFYHAEPKADTDNLYEVVLDQTLFFPEEGGQSPDKGVINGINVVDVQIKNGVIIHTVDIAVTENEAGVSQTRPEMTRQT